MALSKCDCNQFALSHYPIRRNGPYNSSGPAILLICTEQNRPPHGLQENIKHMETFFRGLNLRISIIPIASAEALKYALSVITNPECTRDAPDNIWNARILKVDSLCFIGVIACGDNAYTQLSNGTYVNDVNIEEFFNEEYCVLLRGKPKLFLYFKYYDKSIDGTGTIELKPRTLSLHPEGINWSNPTTSTNMNLLSFYIYEFGIPKLQTESRSSTVLRELHSSYHRNTTDISTFFREFFDQMVDLQSPFKIKKHRLPCICLTRRYRMRSSLYFLQPQYEYSHEEQDWENDLSETLSNYSGLSLTPRATTPHAAPPGVLKHHYSSLDIKIPALHRPNSLSISLATENTPVHNTGKTPLTSHRRKYRARKRKNNSHSQQYPRKPQPYSNMSTYTHPHRKYNSNPPIARINTKPERYPVYYGPNKSTNKNWKRWKRMRVKMRRSQRFDNCNQYNRTDDVTDSVLVTGSNQM